MWRDDESESSSRSQSDEEGQNDKIAAEKEDEEDRESSEDDKEDSEYEQSDKEEEQDDDEDEGGTGESSSSSKSTSPTPRRAARGKLDEKTRLLLEQENLLRRSSRSKTVNTSSKKKSRSKSSDDGDEESESWSDDDRPKKRAQAKKKNKPDNKKIVRTAANKNKKIDYTEKDTDEDIDEDDVLEWEEDVKPSPGPEAQSNGSETIEKVIKWRMGPVGATGSATTSYNVLEKGDPYENGEKTEQQFFIKWVGWSHLHNTWESDASITLMAANGMKKIVNFLKKLKEVNEWRRTADKEYIEFYDCEQVMAEELCDEYKKVERIVAHQVSRDKGSDGSNATEYYIKWSGLPYAECTWEDARLIPSDRIEEYHYRIENIRPPNKSAAVLRKRPKFIKIDEMPEYLNPDNKDQILRDYQLEGLNWMLHAWSKYNSCILADEMGLGKTIQSISFLASLHHRYDLYGPFLVVVPLSTMAAWQKEFAQWAPRLNLVTYMGDVTSRDFIRQYEWYSAGSKKMKVNAVLTTYEILLKDKPFLGSIDWAALMVDEAHRLKNDESLLYKCLSTFSCDHRLLITGTPLQNSLKELWALLHFIMPDMFSSWEDFESDHNDKDHKGISALHKKLEPFLLRRVKKDVEKSLPPKLEQILRVDMTAQQKQFYKWILTKNYRELSKGVKGSINGFVNLVMELKKCCNHTSLVRQYDTFEREAQARLQQLLKSSGKLILLDKLLCRLKETGHRVLIFSQMVMMLDILQEYLQLRRFPSQRLDGSMRADLRKQALDHFNAEGSTDFAFLLSTRAGGLGINLATADTVIIFDSDWNPQNDLQAMSRAHRIGQTRQVNIYRLVTRGSVEEEIVERAKRKLVLDHLVIQRMDTTGRTVLSKSSATGSVPFDKHELNDILKFGAAELFKEKEGEEQEPEVDIDRILSGAETREAEDSQENGNELLNSFKYANFVIDEEKDVAAAANQKTGGEDWDLIIPEEERAKIDEDERKKIEAEMQLAPRLRTKMLEGVEEEGGGTDDSNSDGEEGSGKKKRKKTFGDFSATEIRRFVRSFRKFAFPLERLEALAQDAELEEHSTAELQKLAEALLDGCKKAKEEHSSKKVNEKEKNTKDGEKRVKDRGPQFKFAGVADVNVKQIEKIHSVLAPLHFILSKNGSDTFKLPSNIKPQKGWDIEWTSVDDDATLRGVYKYGLGSWESIKMDPQLGLADKIFIKDKIKKPQPKHLQQRVDLLLKVLGKKDVVKKKTVIRDRKRPADDRMKASGSAKKKKREKADDKHHHSKESKGGKSFSDQLSLLTIDKSLYGEALSDSNEKPFQDCVKMMRPVQKYIKKLSQAENDKEFSRYLYKIGDNCLDQIEDLLKRKPKTNVRKWYNYLWIFLSKFISMEPAELLEKYRKLSISNQKHKHHRDSHGKEDKHDKKDKGDDNHKQKEKERKDHKDRDRNRDRDHHKDRHKDRHHHHSHNDNNHERYDDRRIPTSLVKPPVML